jgi:PleD family two-component response regulator
MVRQVRVLLVGEDGVELSTLQAELDRSGLEHELARVRTESEMLEACRHARPDLILALDSDDTFDAVAALAVARERASDVPLIVIANAAGEEVAVEALKAGATDYIIADRLTRLGPAAKRALEEGDARRRLR